MARYIILIIGLAYGLLAQALTFPVPKNGDLVGQVKVITAKYEDTFAALAREYDVGYYEIVDANPGIDPWIPGEGTRITIPTEFLLPAVPRKGIVINLAELRLYYYSADGKTVTTHPVGIGSEIWPTPTMHATITAKAKDPTWTVPESIMEEHREQGEEIPRVVGPGPNNPLGKYAMRLSEAGYLIHGTNRPIGIGRRVTHGCIRMYPEDIEHLFKIVPVKTDVRIIHEPIKVGSKGGGIYVESHSPLPEYPTDTDAVVEQLVQEIYERMMNGVQVNIDWNLVKEAAKRSTGVPEAVGQVMKD